MDYVYGSEYVVKALGYLNDETEPQHGGLIPRIGGTYISLELAG